MLVLQALWWPPSSLRSDLHVRVLLDAQVCGAAWASVWFKVSQVVPVGSDWAFITAWAHQLPQEGLGWVDIWSRGQYS